MGACLCKRCTAHTEDTSNLSAYEGANSSQSDSGLVNAISSNPNESSSSSPPPDTSQRSPRNSLRSYRCKYIDNLVLETLGIIGRLGLLSNHETPDALHRLHVIGDHEDGWLQVICSMMYVVPIEYPLGPAAITVILDDCPLPDKKTVMKLSKMLNLSKRSSLKGRRDPDKQRNICVIYGVLAEKLPGPCSTGILTAGTVQYLIGNLDKDKIDPTVTLFSLIALEKFAQITENKMLIASHLDNIFRNPLFYLELWINSENCVKAQVGFCARWCLDNLFPIVGRKSSYLTTDTSKLNAMLNSKDTSEYLKLSADGLEARCDAYSFESVRCTFEVNKGIWYYEATVLSSGVMQIGWSTLNSLYRNHDGFGIGDDEFSVSYDGCRQQLWYSAANRPIKGHHAWEPGDVVGCLINLPEKYVRFYLNGKQVIQTSNIFNVATSGFYAAASFMTFQHCRFNFGSKPFKFPPRGILFSDFNSNGKLSNEEKLVQPRHLLYQKLQNLSITEDSCTLCYDDRATMKLLPCGHNEFCKKCVKQLTKCPVCRSPISEIILSGTLVSV